MVENRHQDRVEHRLDAGDQAGGHRRRGFQADGQQDIGHRHLKDTQHQQTGQGDGLQFFLPQQEGQSGDCREDVPPEYGGDGVGIRQLIHQENTRVGHAGHQGQHVAQAAPHLQAVREEEKHPAEHDAAGQQIQPPRLSPPEQGGKQDDKNRRSKLKDDHIGRCGQLVGHGEQGVGAEDAQRPHRDPAVEPERMADRRQIGPNHHQGNGGAGPVDGHTSPGDQLDAQPADAVQHRRQKDAQRPSPSLIFHALLPHTTKSPLSGDRTEGITVQRGTTSGSPAPRRADLTEFL